LKTEVEKLQKRKATFASALKQIEQERDISTKKVTNLEIEKKELIRAALASQDDQRKYKVILEKFEGKLDQFLKILYGEPSFTTILKDCTKSGQLYKQGGKNSTKWQKRLLVLNGNFLLYYSAMTDKEPKGVIRMDSESVLTSKCDLFKLNIKHAFTIVKQDKTGRAYFFSANSEEECVDWIRVLLLSQGWPLEEINSYIEAQSDQSSAATKSPSKSSTTTKNGTLRK